MLHGWEHQFAPVGAGRTGRGTMLRLVEYAAMAAQVAVLQAENARLRERLAMVVDLASAPFSTPLPRSLDDVDEGFDYVNGQALVGPQGVLRYENRSRVDR